MVARLIRLFAAALLLLPLSACIFVLSPFPATLSQVVAKTDLSSLIPAGSGNGYRPFIVSPTGGEFVLLMSYGSDPVVIVMDSNLAFIQSYTLGQLQTLYTSYDPGGHLAMTNAEGNAEISNVAFSAMDLSSVGAGPSWVGNATLLSPGFGSPTAQKDVIDFDAAAGNSLGYVIWPWFYPPGTDIPCGVTLINASGGSYQVEAVFDVDDTPSAGEVVLVLSDNGNSSHVTLVAIPLYDILNGSVASPLLSNYASKTLSNIASSSIGFAGDCIVAYSQDSGSLKRYSLSTFEEISSLPVGEVSYRIQYAYNASGGYSVVYDPDARTITKVANWW
jgi:hypothetical protein